MKALVQMRRTASRGRPQGIATISANFSPSSMATARDRHHKRELQPLLNGDRKGSPLLCTNGTPGFRGIVVALVGPLPLRCTRCLTRQQSLQKGEHYGNEIW